MIELEFIGMCKGCKIADLKLEPYYYEGQDGESCLWTISCTHQRACERMEEKMNEVKE